MRCRATFFRLAAGRLRWLSASVLCSGCKEMPIEQFWIMLLSRGNSSQCGRQVARRRREGRAREGASSVSRASSEEWCERELRVAEQTAQDKQNYSAVVSGYNTAQEEKPCNDYLYSPCLSTVSSSTLSSLLPLRRFRAASGGRFHDHGIVVTACSMLVLTFQADFSVARILLNNSPDPPILPPCPAPESWISSGAEPHTTRLSAVLQAWTPEGDNVGPLARFLVADSTHGGTMYGPEGPIHFL
nr:hypothetical protein CFP56_77628 [Quercus suber]